VTWVLVCAGGALGAVLRYLADRAVQRRRDSLFPWGTLAVNVAGSLVLGLLLGVARARDVPAGLLLGLATGFCGALTTYSTFAFETARLSRDGARLVAAANAGASVAAGLGAAALGLAVAQAL
jgi:fluoride exporter